MSAEGWELDRLQNQWGGEYDILRTAEGITAVPHETGREPLKAHTATVLGIMLGQAAADRALPEPPLERVRRHHAVAERAHERREARR